MIKKINLYIRMIYKIVKNEVIGNFEYKAAYNDVAMTYQSWLEKMGQHTEKIINPKYLESKSQNEKIRILDFACGTGYISRKIIDLGIPCEITAVDLSDKMLEACADLAEQGVKIMNIDGLDFLNNTTQKFDVILCGWALPYFQHKELIEKFQRVLSNHGIVGVISNCKGTLDRIEKIFLNVMEEDIENVNKPMNISFNLPKGKATLIKWFARSGFKTLEAGEGETIFSFEDPKKLLEWLSMTGALAGSTHIFNNYELAKNQILNKIKYEKYKDDQYYINHKFVYGLFQNGGNNNGSK
ncbi:MAG: hypothetical protein CVV02_12390 [Firmicutes bacterium HGW-Firmicutes-7]|nr:MAG: hypothetical protein CVV02_12390 [Firmicutes bacterium HGW-Firmicutes-7]